MQADECDRQCVREPAQCSLRRRGRREITGPRDVTCVSYWAGARPLDSTTQDTGPRGAFCSRGVWGLPGCLSVRPAVKIHSFIPEAETVLLLVLRLDDLSLSLADGLGGAIDAERGPGVHGHRERTVA